MSIVSSENLACSQADPTISISCRLSVMWGVLSQGGVVRGLNLEPEPLWVNTGGVTLSHSERRMARAFELSMNSAWLCNDCVYMSVCVCVRACLHVYFWVLFVSVTWVLEDEFCVQKNNECMNSVQQWTGDFYDRAERKELSSVTYFVRPNFIESIENDLESISMAVQKKSSNWRWNIMQIWWKSNLWYAA